MGVFWLLGAVFYVGRLVGVFMWGWWVGGLCVLCFYVGLAGLLGEGEEGGLGFYVSEVGFFCMSTNG